MSKLKDFSCIICDTNITDSSTISIRNYMRPLSNPELSLYSFFQLISNFDQLDISEVPQNACDKCYQHALHVLDFQTLCNKAVENIKTDSEDIKPIDIEHVYVGNDCEDGSLSIYLPEEDTVDGYDVVEIMTKHSDNAKDEDIASLPAPAPAIRKRKRPKVELAKDVECGYCHKLYNRDYIHVHKRIHTGERPFKCKLCPKDFNNASSLEYHMRIHNDKQPYMCKICGKTFRSKGNHDVHYTTHSDEKPFACPECPKRFRRDAHLKQHIVTHVKDKPIECTLCGNRFTHSLGLRRHQTKSCQGPKINEASLM